MSQRDVQTWDEVIGALNAGELDRLYDYFDPEVTYTSREDEPDRIVDAGLDDFKTMVETWTDMFDSFRIDIEQTDDLGDRTISVTRIRGVSIRMVGCAASGGAQQAPRMDRPQTTPLLLWWETT